MITKYDKNNENKDTKRGGGEVESGKEEHKKSKKENLKGEKNRKKKRIGGRKKMVKMKIPKRKKFQKFPQR